ncbi:MAG: ABC transporter permease subunit [Anaerolineales bacterium]|nr:ABC transporter permease subunit [Anaerolineales bacterium]
MDKDNRKPNIWKSLTLGLAVLLGIVVYAYGAEVTRVNLGELQSERRQESMVRVLRALFRPDLLEYDQVLEPRVTPIYVPCPAGGVPEDLGDPRSGGYITVTPACGSPGDVVRVEGFNFMPNAEGPLRFVPGSDPENPVGLGQLFANTDAQGNFSMDFTLPNRESEDVQYIRVIMRQNEGAPYFTQNAKDTWDRIVETVFMALLATTIGTVLAVPISFTAARNLMKPVRSPIASIALNVIGWLAGIYLAYQVAAWIGGFTQQYVSVLPIALASVVVVPIIANFAFRWAVPVEDAEPPTRALQIVRNLVLLGIAALGIYALYALAGAMSTLGPQLARQFSGVAFMGNFLFRLGGILDLLVPTIAALMGGGALGGLLARVGQQATERLPEAAVKTMNIVLAGLAGAVLAALFGAFAEWVYQFGNPVATLWWPAIIGAAAGVLLAVLTQPKATLGVGIALYYVIRTILNALRSIEALVMAIVFVIAVGIGPFAGMLALGLHTIVSLAKLYSEQVESISSGPMEALQATGANSLQTIVYAVVPQIIPPYIAYTLYRWDINVRMSTIIGFVGGGGIGFLLQQNINLLNYRGASTQMVAIAVVVATLDYISSVVRERYT